MTSERRGRMAGYGTECLSGPECGLCFTRSGQAVPLDRWEWRRRLGPVTEVDRTGEYPRRSGPNYRSLRRRAARPVPVVSGNG